MEDGKASGILKTSPNDCHQQNLRITEMGFAGALEAVYEILIWILVNNNKTLLVLLQTLLGFKKAFTRDLLVLAVS